MVSPGPISVTSPPREWTRPRPSVTCRVWPTAWECQAVRAHGAKRTMFTRIRDGSSPLAITSNPDVAGEHLGRALGGRLPGLDLHCLSLVRAHSCLCPLEPRVAASSVFLASTVRTARRLREALLVPRPAGPPTGVGGVF